MPKTYAEFMDELTAEELYKGLVAYGMFTEKLPPVLTSEPFFAYCQVRSNPFFDQKEPYISYESMRNINIPRMLGIPNPMAYERLCRCIADYWDRLKEHFTKQTAEQDYMVSRIHIRKMEGKNPIFFMNYKNWKLDGMPEPDLMIGCKYLVKADISSCFPSICAQAISWALVGKEAAKENKPEALWCHQLSHYAQHTNNGESRGLLIGPHSSNVLSEIILTAIDCHLYQKGWRYIRNIDDYTCYVPSYEDGQKFLVDLGEELQSFDLSLNHKKTEICELPVASVEQWVRKINSVPLNSHHQIDFRSARAYLDSAIELMQANQMNSAILNYAIQVLKGQELTPGAKEYSIKTIFHLVLLYPYLIPQLETTVFSQLGVTSEQIAFLSQKIYQSGLQQHNYEAVCYAIYYAMKYGFELPNFHIAQVVHSGDCLFCLLSFLYFQRQGANDTVEELKKYALQLSQNEEDFNKNWLFVYEILSEELTGDWLDMKQNGVSFIKPEYRYH